MEVLDFDNIFNGEEINSFEDLLDDSTATAKAEDKQSDKTKEAVEDNEKDDTAEVDPDTLFEENPESVGSEKEKKTEVKEDTPSEEDGASPDTNFYSSIASALKEEGIFPDLDDKDTDSVKSPEDFRDLIEKQIHAGLQEAQKRIYDALNTGVEPNVVRQYENTLRFLNSVTDEHIEDEGQQGEQLRRQLLEQDFKNRGYSPERAAKMTEKLFDSGDDVEEAKQALQANKEFYGGKYQAILEEAKQVDEMQKAAIKKQAEDLKKDIMTNEKVFGDIEVTKATRQKIYDNISKPVYRDPETGDYYTALQKYKRENENDFLRNVGMLFTLTDGFKDLSKLVQPSAKKEVKKKLKELEHTLNNTSRNSSGVLKYVGSSNSGTDKSIFDQGFSIDI